MQREQNIHNSCSQQPRGLPPSQDALDVSDEERKRLSGSRCRHPETLLHGPGFLTKEPAHRPQALGSVYTKQLLKAINKRRYDEQGLAELRLQDVMPREVCQSVGNQLHTVLYPLLFISHHAILGNCHQAPFCRRLGQRDEVDQRQGRLRKRQSSCSYTIVSLAVKSCASPLRLKCGMCCISTCQSRQFR